MVTVVVHLTNGSECRFRDTSADTSAERIARHLAIQIQTGVNATVPRRHDSHGSGRHTTIPVRQIERVEIWDDDEVGEAPKH